MSNEIEILSTKWAYIIKSILQYTVLLAMIGHHNVLSLADYDLSTYLIKKGEGMIC